MFYKHEPKGFTKVATLPRKARPATLAVIFCASQPRCWTSSSRHPLDCSSDARGNYTLPRFLTRGLELRQGNYVTACHALSSCTRL